MHSARAIAGPSIRLLYGLARREKRHGMCVQGAEDIHLYTVAPCILFFANSVIGARHCRTLDGAILAYIKGKAGAHQSSRQRAYE
jgi:hypothetical protein